MSPSGGLHALGVLVSDTRVPLSTTDYTASSFGLEQSAKAVFKSLPGLDLHIKTTTCT